MKKSILILTITSCFVFAFDLSSAAKVLSGSSSDSTSKSTLGFTANSIGKKLASMVKPKAPKTYEQAKIYCKKASTYKSFIGLDSGMIAKGVEICANSFDDSNTTK